MSIKQAIEALELAQNMVDWCRNLHPQQLGKADHEADAQIAAALAALRSMPAEPVAIELDQALKERDDAEDMADQLADQIAAITGAEIGEHTSANDPWRNAMLAADEWIAEDLRRMFDGRQEQPRPPVAHRLRNAPSEIDYDLLIAACYEQTRQAQGTKGCVQFAKGAEWYRELISATPHTEAVRMSEADEPMRAHVEAFAAGYGWQKGDPEGAFEFVQRKCYRQGWEDGRREALGDAHRDTPETPSLGDASRVLEPYLGKDVPDKEVVLLDDLRAVEQATAARLGVKMGDV